MKVRIVNFLVTLAIVCLAAWAAWVLYLRYLNDPWTVSVTGRGAPVATR